MTLFHECGWASWAALGAGVIGLFVGLVALSLAFAKPRVGGAFALLALGIALLPAGCGMAGRMQGERITDQVVDSAAIDPTQRERIRAEGYRESAACTTVGLGATAAPFFLSALALVVAFARRGQG